MWFSFDGESFETHASEAEAEAVAKRAMQFWSDHASDGWDSCAEQVCYGRVTHAVRVEPVPVTDENRYQVPDGCEGIEMHHLERIDDAGAMRAIYTPCPCGNQTPDNPEYCQHPGCDARGCEECDEVEYCHTEGDEADGDCFCSKHRTVDDT